jgi:hypothetical protein
VSSSLGGTLNQVRFEGAAGFLLVRWIAHRELVTR